MLAGLHQVYGYRRLSESLAGFQAMQTLNQDKTLAIGAHENGRFLSFGQHALGKSLNLLPIKSLTPLDRHIDILNCNHLLFHHLCCSWPKSRVDECYSLTMLRVGKVIELAIQDESCVLALIRG